MEAPNQTIYAKNLNEKIKIDVLKKMLYMAFSQYGKVKAINAIKGKKTRGQVFLFSFSFSITTFYIIN
jgi:U2 small nuclear ribonucleoprotein B''